MAIALEFIDFIVPIALIRKKYPGGWDKCLQDYEHLIGGRVWFDDHLFRDGAMSPSAIKMVVDHWQELGFEPFMEEDGKQVWKDFCVAELGGSTLPCDWVDFTEEGWAAFLKGTEPGRVIGRDDMDYQHK